MAAPATPRDAAAVILLDRLADRLADRPADPLVYWVRRHERMAFQGGFHAFPGGQRDKGDADVPLAGARGDDGDVMRAAAARELFEETGVLLARGAEKLGADELRRMRGQLCEEGEPFGELLRSRGLAVDASSLSPGGRWVTPPFSPRRFDTWFFTAWLPPGQRVELWEGELDSGEWLRPAEAVAAWGTGRLLVAPPILHAMRTLAGGLDDLEARLASIPEARGAQVRRIEFRPGIVLFPLRTPTRPPATHTNCYVVGGRDVVVIDPGSPYEDEQAALDELLDDLAGEGRRVREVVLTHLHPDHVGGANHLRERLGVPVAAHRLTAAALEGSVAVDRFVEDGERFEFDADPPLALVALHTPGHARGHLCFLEEGARSLITGDLIVGLGTVVIDPPEGEMAAYLRSLERVRSLEPTAIFGGHGPAIGAAIAKIDEYVAHRLEREEAIAGAVRGGGGTPAEIVAAVYTDVPESLHALAERSVLAHLEKLEAEGRVAREGDGRYYPRI
jgi:glyoxylase-like metal-dependent hydrolase (beta-lactamase superfamily II)/8-oxo-dGTP pyrophosphatase MutT (NUDIX family)